MKEKSTPSQIRLDSANPETRDAWLISLIVGAVAAMWLALWLESKKDQFMV